MQDFPIGGASSYKSFEKSIPFTSFMMILPLILCRSKSLRNWSEKEGVGRNLERERRVCEFCQVRERSA